MLRAIVLQKLPPSIERDGRTLSMLTDEEARLITGCSVEVPDFEILNVNTSPVGDRCGFMSDYLRIKIRIKTNNEENELNFFAKTIPRERLLQRKFIEETQSYWKEVGFYTDVIKCLYKYQDNAFNGKLKSSPRSKWTPYCYYARSDTIVMEDLSLGGFQLTSRRDVMDLDQCVAVLTELASFHAASIIFEEREKKKLIDVCSDIFSNRALTTSLADDDSKGWFIAGQRALVALVPLLTRYQNNKNLQQKIQSKIPETCSSVFPFTETAPFRKVACHGDLWTNNILFQHRHDAAQPYAVRFVDFQLLRYAAPATDIVIFLYSCTDGDFRRRHFRTLIDVYADALRSELKRNDLDADTVLPADEVRRSCDAFLGLGCVIAALDYQLILTPEEAYEALFASEEQYNKYFLQDRANEVCEYFKKDAVFRSRMEEVLYELIESHILNEK